MFPAISKAATAVQSAHDRLEVSANNIANVGTPGFEPERVIPPPSESNASNELPERDSSSPDGPFGKEGPAEVDGPSKVDLAREVANQIQLELESRANLKVIRSQSETLGSVIDTFG